MSEPKIWYLPLQPLEERYTKQWYTLFVNEFKRRGLLHYTVGGESLTDRVEVGTFLDVNSTLYWQASQLRDVAELFRNKEIKDGDIFFAADVEFWGIESIRYLATLNGVDVKLMGFCHAGSYTHEDFFAKCAPFAKWYEFAWGQIFDKIFVGSYYHKLRLVKDRSILADKIFVTGNPYDIDGVKAIIPKVKKIKRVIHTNRPDPEKRPAVTLEVFRLLKQQHPDWELMVTTSRKQWGEGALRDVALKMQEMGIIKIREGISKLEYLTLLAESTVMTGNSPEENFGYCILEALMVDTIPVVGNCCSHPELLGKDERCLFVNPEHQRILIQKAMAHPYPVYPYAAKYKGSLPLIVEHLISSNDAPGELL